jgi:CarD family transcriptional regulator, regulator of rRNA transcription
VNFRVGEKVIYPNHGIGVVESIQTRPTAAGKISLYQLRIVSNDSRVWVPQQNADGVGLRPVINTGDVRKIFTLLGDGNIDQHPNWKGRFKENSDKMRTGSLYEVAVVLKGLTFLSRKKSLSFREKRMLERAKFLLVSEIAEVEGKAVAAVEERVDRALNKSFAPEIKPASKKPIQRPVGLRRPSDA